MAGILYRDPVRAISGGVIYPGARLSVLEPDGETLAAIYADAALDTRLSNPLIADSAGRLPPIYAALGAELVARLVDASGEIVFEETITPDLMPLSVYGADPRDDSGRPLPYATREYFAADTTEHIPTYDGDDLTTPLPNPSTAGESGAFEATYLDPALAYRTILRDRHGRLIYDVADGRVINLPPTAPVLSGALNGDEDGIDLSWTESASPYTTIAGYRLYDADTDALIVDQAGRTYEFTPVESDVLYRFYVVAYDAQGLVSPHSNIVAIQKGATAWTPAWINPGAELGDMTGWTVTQGAMTAAGPTASPSRSPPSGSWCFDGGQGAANSRAYQRVDLLASGVPSAQIDASNTRITMDWNGGAYIQPSPDQPQINFLYRDEDEALIDTYSSGLKAPSTTVGVYRWSSYQEVDTIPAGTRYIDVEMHGRRNTGTYNDASFDDVGAPVIDLISP